MTHLTCISYSTRRVFSATRTRTFEWTNAGQEFVTMTTKLPQPHFEVSYTRTWVRYHLNFGQMMRMTTELATGASYCRINDTGPPSYRGPNMCN
ncbi:hypothetical protein TNCV_4308451 [Trichonephila clavipes]|nr:hypothetical protein TNCV_4308451 [Trichonephila clavipes]